ncbi:MAG TPA: TIGR03089 family protein [Microlunatus sp.]|nr:TIGR03089 family protein [Microlunatus sp.]
MQLISQRLRRRTARAGADPLVTYYDLGTGERTELSAVTVSNWVDKTSNLLADEYGLDLGDQILLDVARTHPGHWVTACLELACWSLGVTVAVDSGAADGAPTRLVVAGPLYTSAAERATELGAELLACSLHPLGLPFTERLPEGVADFSLEVRGQPDQYAAATVPADVPAWRSVEATLTQAELAGARESTQRRLVRPSTPWPTARDGIVAALIGGGSVVVAVGEDEAALARVRDTENIESEVG